MFVLLEPFAVRKLDPALHATQLARTLRRKFARLQEAQVAVFGAPPIEGMGNTGGFKLQVRDRLAQGPVALENAVAMLADGGNAQPGLTGLFSSFRATQPQLFVDIDREKVKAQGIDISEVNQTLQIYLGGAYANDFTAYGRPTSSFGRRWPISVGSRCAAKAGRWCRSPRW